MQELRRRLRRQRENDEGCGSQEVPRTRQEGKKPAPVLRAEREERRQLLYDAQCNANGVLIPGRACYPRTAAHENCPHYYRYLKFGENASARYASCTNCHLSHVLYEDKESNKVWMITPVGDGDEAPSGKEDSEEESEESGEEPQEDAHFRELNAIWTAESMQADPDEAISDSGCKAAVGGEIWHKALQEEMKRRGLIWHEVPEDERFQFGLGHLPRSRKAFLYPVGIHGKVEVLRMSCIQGACPGLVSPVEMKRWLMKYDHGQNTVSKGEGTPRPLKLTAAGHPAFKLMEFDPETDLTRVWESKRMRAWHHSMMQENYLEARIDSSGDEMPPLYASSESEGDIYTQGPRRNHFVHYVDDSSEEESGAGETMCPSSKALDELMSEDSRSSGDESVDPQLMRLLEGTAMSSPELFKEDSSEPDERDYDEMTTFAETSHDYETVDEESEEQDGVSDSADEAWTVNSRVRTADKKTKALVKETYEEMELAAQVNPELKRARRPGETTPGPKEPAPRREHRRPGPYRVLEVCTWTCMVTMVAMGMGWEGLEPITLPRWNLFKSSDIRAASEYLCRSDPDLVVCAWPCSPWSQLQRINQRNAFQRDRLTLRRKQHRQILKFINLVCKHQRRRRRCLLGENPQQSEAWKEPSIEKGFEGCAECVTHACCWGKRRPDNGLLIHKPTKLKGDKEIIQELDRRCSRDHDHSVVEGSMRIMEGGIQKTVCDSEWAGGYRSFCKSYHPRSREDSEEPRLRQHIGEESVLRR